MIDGLVWLRASHDIATCLASGTVCFVLLTGDPAADGLVGPSATAYAGLRRQCISMALLALLLAVLSGTLWLIWVAGDILGEPPSTALADGGLWQILTTTRFGEIAGLRLTVAVGLGLSIRWPAARGLSLIAAIALIGLMAWTGHAGATPGAVGRVLVVADFCHLVAAAAWLGGLPALVLLLAETRSGHGAIDRLAIRSIRRFSILGMVSVAVLAGTGVVNGWRQLGGIDELWTNDYGRLLAFKIALFAAMVTIAAINRQRLTPRLSDPAAIHSLYRNSLAEFALGLGVLFLVALLGTMNPSQNHPPHMHISSAELTVEMALVHNHHGNAMANNRFNATDAGKTDTSLQLWREEAAPFAITDREGALNPHHTGDKSVNTDVQLVPSIADVRPLPRRPVAHDRASRPGRDAPVAITQCSNEC